MRRKANRRRRKGPLFKSVVNDHDNAHADEVIAQQQPSALDKLASTAVNILDSNSAVVNETIVELPDEDDSPSDGDEITVLWDRRKENLLPLAIQPQPDDVLLSYFNLVHRCPECCRSRDVNAMVLCNNCRNFQCKDCFVKGCDCVAENQSAESCDCDSKPPVVIETCNYALTGSESVNAILGGTEWVLDIQYLNPHENTT